MRIYFNDDYAASECARETTRKAVAIAAHLRNARYDGIELMDPAREDFELTAEEIGIPGVFGATGSIFFDETANDSIGAIHDPRYVRAVKGGTPRTLAESNGFPWDPGMHRMAHAHIMGLVAATSHVLGCGTTAGTLSSGLHHAGWSGGKGNCTYNGLAAAAYHAITHKEVDRILILDFDAHCGGGTWDIVQRLFPDKVVQVDVSTAMYDTWTPTGSSILRFSHPTDYMTDIESALDHARGLGSFDLVLYNAGMDPINGGVDPYIVKMRERAVRDFIDRTPAVFALAGGYFWGGHTMDDIVDWHMMTVREWAGIDEMTFGHPDRSE